MQASHPEEQRDFFISFAGADRKLAEWIAKELEAHGCSTYFQPWDFRPGSNFVLEMHKAARHTRRTLVVLSPDYLNGEFTQAEWASAFRQDPTGSRRTVIPIRVRPCTPDSLLGPIVYEDLVGLSEAEARERLFTAISDERPKPRLDASFAPAAVFNVPYLRNSAFTGRREVIRDLRGALTAGTMGILSQVIVGLGGIGKTQTALEYAYEYEQEYRYVFWVIAETEQTLNSEFRKLPICSSCECRGTGAIRTRSGMLFGSGWSRTGRGS